MIKIIKPFIVLETKNTQIVFEIKPFEDSRAEFMRGKSFVIQRHYGHKINVDELQPSKPEINLGGACEDYIVEPRISSAVGDCNNNEPFVILDLKEESYTNRFFYKDAEIIKGGVDVIGPHSRNVKESLIITEEDEVSKVEIQHIYSIFEDSDVIAVKTRLNNHGDDLKINRLMSLQLPIDSIDLDVYSFNGRWLFERMRTITNIKDGAFIIDSKIGSSSHKHNPFIEVFDKQNKVYYAFNFIYSGNHKEIVEVDHCYNSRVLVGLNDYCFAYEVKKGESFTTPEAIMLISDDLDEITHQMHQFALNHIVNPHFKNKPRPIIFNSWEGTAFRIDEKSLLDMASIASSVGVEQFVVDDGWFINRICDDNGLGDWIVDKNKFPNGLGSFAKKIRGYGLKFGFWIEPEMISPKSDLCKAHPEFASKIPNREALQRRTQLMIDMTNKEVVDYLFNVLSDVIDDAKPDYIKWDFNRFMSDNYSHAGVKKGEYMYRFMMGSYSLMERLTNKYPNILFEGCSSGGGRFDLGILYYMPQTWASDDSNSYWRCFIACGTLVAYPQSSLGAHVSRDGNPHKTLGGISSLDDRFNINCLGAFGYEFDFRTFKQEELDIMAKQTAYFKEHRELLQYGNYQVLANCFDDDRYFGYIVVSENKEEAIMMVAELKPNMPSRVWKAKGLNEQYKYHLVMRPQYNLKEEQLLDVTLTGKELMDKGIDLGSLYSTTDKEKFSGIFSRMIYLKRI